MKLYFPIEYAQFQYKIYSLMLIILEMHETEALSVISFNLLITSCKILFKY